MSQPRIELKGNMTLTKELSIEVMERIVKFIQIGKIYKINDMASEQY